MNEHDFCRASLTVARAMAREAGVKVPRLWTYTTQSTGYTRWVEITDRDGALLWQGSACCAYEAKANFITSLLPDESEEG